jgi:signal peptidase I
VKPVGVGVGATLGALCLLALAAAARHRIAIVTVSGISMEPALKPGDRIVVRRPRIKDLRPGQVVVFEEPDQAGTWPSPPRRRPDRRAEWMIKRIVAAPGDPAPAYVADHQAASLLVPPDMVVVLGDNLKVSMDSRMIGYIPAQRLAGVMVRTLPRRRAG